MLNTYKMYSKINFHLSTTDRIIDDVYNMSNFMLYRYSKSEI